MENEEIKESEKTRQPGRPTLERQIRLMSETMINMMERLENTVKLLADKSTSISAITTRAPAQAPAQAPVQAPDQAPAYYYQPPDNAALIREILSAGRDRVERLEARLDQAIATAQNKSESPSIEQILTLASHPLVRGLFGSQQGSNSSPQEIADAISSVIASLPSKKHVIEQIAKKECNKDEAEIV